ELGPAPHRRQPGDGQPARHRVGADKDVSVEEQVALGAGDYPAVRDAGRNSPNERPDGSRTIARASPSGSSVFGTMIVASSFAGFATYASTSSPSTNSCTRLCPSGGDGQTPPLMPRPFPVSTIRYAIALSARTFHPN